MAQTLATTFSTADPEARVPQVAYLEAASAVDTIYRGKLARARFLAAQPNARVLDVGCGIGDATLLIARHLAPGGTAVGLDAHDGLLEEARARTAAPRAAEVRFVSGDAAAMPFADDSFDAAQVERVLQHVEDPGAVLAEMCRVVRPGGVVLAVEPDWGTLVVDSADPEVGAAVTAAAAAMIRHGRIGRGLRRNLADAGLRDISVHVESHVTESPSVARHLGLVDEAVAQLRSGGEWSGDRLDAWLESIRTAGEAGRFSAALSLFVACGTVPAR